MPLSGNHWSCRNKMSSRVPCHIIHLATPSRRSTRFGRPASSGRRHRKYGIVLGSSNAVPQRNLCHNVSHSCTRKSAPGTSLQLFIKRPRTSSARFSACPVLLVATVLMLECCEIKATSRMLHSTTSTTSIRGTVSDRLTTRQRCGTVRKHLLPAHCRTLTLHQVRDGVIRQPIRAIGVCCHGRKA